MSCLTEEDNGDAAGIKSYSNKILRIYGREDKPARWRWSEGSGKEKWNYIDIECERDEEIQHVAFLDSRMDRDTDNSEIVVVKVGINHPMKKKYYEKYYQIHSSSLQVDCPQ
jgi:hypothetical protein